MAAFAVETKLHYPVMTEKQLATRWKISVKTLRRWRLDMAGPVGRKLFRNVRYHDSDVLAFKRQSAQHWMGFLGRDESAPIILASETIGSDSSRGDKDAESDAGSLYLTGKEVAAITGLPAYLFADREERDSKRIPYLALVGNVRYNLEEILRWELASSTPGITHAPVAPIPAIAA